MTDVEMRFFDEYKKLDALCKDMYAFEKGVTDYLNNMEENFQQGTHTVRGWDRDYRAIKRLRHIRNLIGHQMGNSGCTEADFNDLQRIHLRFLQHEDPLLLLKKAEYEAEKADNKAENTMKYAKSEAAYMPMRRIVHRSTHKRQGGWYTATIVLLLAALAIAVAGIAAILFTYA